MQFIRGQKQKLSGLTSSRKLKATIDIDPRQADELDIACFGLDSVGKLSDDRYFIFFNQLSSPEGAIRAELQGNKASFEIDLDALPKSIQRLAFTVTADGANPISRIGTGSFRLYEGNRELLSFSFSGQDFSDEKAIMLFDIYYKDEWRVSAVGQGFREGLKALLEHFGGSAIESASPAPPKSPEPKPEPPKVSLSKITLEKPGDSQKIDLRKKDGPQTIHINLNWDQTFTKKGFLGSRTASADLDLGCMYELVDGEKSVIQALGGNFGNRSGRPWIYLDKDDRSGSASDGENLYILEVDKVRRVLVYAFIYEGAGNFSDVNGKVFMKDGLGNEITINLDAPDSRKTFCAICTLVNDGNALKITKEEQYFRGHSDADKFYSFGFRWTSGSK